MTIQPGTDIGRYHILEQLGQGGMAVVYKAYDTRLESEVAVKVLRTERLIPEYRERTLKRFQIEAKKMAALQHPNIVGIKDFGEFENVPYLVMEYIPSGTLKERCGEPMLATEAAGLLKPIADALSYAHSKGLIHRDIKPGNILITETGDPMLTDFGIAKILVSEETLDLTVTGMGVGTPEYMAPEQAEGKSIDERADIYSLGVVLYELVTGHKPFEADTPMAVMLKQANDPLPLPSYFNPDLTKEAEHVLLKALAKDPKDRYSDMNAFSSAMQGIPVLENIGDVHGTKPHLGKLKSSHKGAKSFNYSRLIGILGVIAVCIAVLVWGSFTKNSGEGETVLESKEGSLEQITAENHLSDQPDLGELRFEENFEGSNYQGRIPSGWHQWQIMDDGEGNQVLSIDMVGYDLYPDQYTFGDYSWKNPVVSYRVKLVECSENGLGSLINLGEEYYLNMSCRHNQIYFNQWDGPNIQEINIDVKEGRWYDFTIGKSDSDFFVYIDGVKVLNLSGGFEYRGKFGFSTEPGSCSYYDDLKIF